MCNNNPSCISFEHRKTGGDNKCQLSSSCTYSLTTQTSPSSADFDFYEKDSSESGLGCAWFVTGQNDYWSETVPSGESVYTMDDGHLGTGPYPWPDEQGFAYRVCRASDASSDCTTVGDISKSHHSRVELLCVHMCI